MNEDHKPGSFREDLTREEVIQLAMTAYGWTERKCSDWYKLEVKGLNGNSPKELVERKQTGKIVEFLNHAAQIRRPQF